MKALKIILILCSFMCIMCCSNYLASKVALSNLPQLVMPSV